MFVTKLGPLGPMKTDNKTAPYPGAIKDSEQTGGMGFGFDKMEHLLAACRRLCSMAYEGKSSAYRTDEGHYFLLLGNHSGRRPPLSDRDGLLSVMEEYGVRQNAAAISLYIREHAVPICEDEAVWRLGRL